MKEKKFGIDFGICYSTISYIERVLFVMGENHSRKSNASCGGKHKEYAEAQPYWLKSFLKNNNV